MCSRSLRQEARGRRSRGRSRPRGSVPGRPALVRKPGSSVGSVHPGRARGGAGPPRYPWPLPRLGPGLVGNTSVRRRRQEGTRRPPAEATRRRGSCLSRRRASEWQAMFFHFGLAPISRAGHASKHIGVSSTEASNRPGTHRTAVGKVEAAHKRRSSSSCFAERVPHRLTCQPPWRERLRRNRPRSRRIPGRGPPTVPEREETVPTGFPPAGKRPAGIFSTHFSGFQPANITERRTAIAAVS